MPRRPRPIYIYTHTHAIYKISRHRQHAHIHTVVTVFTRITSYEFRSTVCVVIVAHIRHFHPSSSPFCPPPLAVLYYCANTYTYTHAREYTHMRGQCTVVVYIYEASSNVWSSISPPPPPPLLLSQVVMSGVPCAADRHCCCLLLI